jgi:hypothetical protein
MDFSAQFDDLQKRVGEAKAAAQTAATESRDQLKQRKPSSRAARSPTRHEASGRR